MDFKNIRKRDNRDKRHNNRCIEENSETISHFPFILGFQVYFMSGDKNTPKRDFIVHFECNEPLLPKHFEKVLHNKLNDVIDK